ncbi:probable disease resistance protein At4g27220 [Euphorbia lathyris]|uniref:probable disease resistance protein At4g27220 n=1 Tax=Euphorbia lathyris TaxID=212925 RepID=UPI0033142720
MEVLIGSGSSVAADAGNSLLSKIKTHIGYLIHYNNNMKGLEDSRVNLDAKFKDANQFSDDTNRMLKVVSSTVQLWRSEAEKLLQEAQAIIPQNNRRRLFPNLWSHYSSSKKACELTQEINEKVRNAPHFGTSFDRPAPELGSKFDLAGFTEFESRVSVVNEVWEALKDEKVRMCSICGMGGIGKTMLARKLIQRVERDHLFDKVAMVTVSQNPDPKKIRNDIMSSLGWKFESKELSDCLMQNDKSILLILDDVWEVLDFDEIGLPKARLKILLTSRKKDVCQIMGSEPTFVINVLTNEEARGLFKEIAMGSIEKWKLQHNTARKIADECGGLPIVIVTLATALKYEVKGTWNDSLRKLQKSNLLGISGMEKVYSRIQLSYDLLKDKEAQTCFRLCGLYPEDHDVPVENLVLYGKGLQLFEGVESLKETRDRVGSIIDKLKKSFLLLDGEKDGCVKMHDILRDFAISISSKDKHPYIAGSEKVMEKWPETSQYENCSAISFVCDEIKEHPVDLKCPKLELLQLIMRIGLVGLPIGIFEGLKELKVLVLQVPSMLQSFSMLRNVRTLVISICEENGPPKIADLLGHGDMKNLEILEFSTGYPYDDFPKEIGLLCNLRHLKFGTGFQYLPPGVLSNLAKLEELQLPWKYISWGSKERGGERVNASLNELESLPLITLKVSVPNGSILGETLVNNLTRFNVFMGSSARRSGYFYDSNAALELYEVDAFDHVTMHWIRSLLTKCESLVFHEVRNLKNILCLQSVEGNGFPQLKDVYIESCSEMEYLIDIITEPIPSFFSQLKRLRLRYMHSLKEIWNSSKMEAPCFSNLSEIMLYRCSKLKYLFPLSMARELRQLQCISIKYCKEMEKIFYRDEALDDGNQVVSSGQMSIPTVETTSTTTIFNSNIDEKPQPTCPRPISFISCLLGREKQPKMVSNQQIMEENIAEVEVEVDETKVDDVMIFPQLKTLELVCLDELRTLCDANHTIELPSLQGFRITRCDKMEALSYGSFNAPRLEHVDVNNAKCRAGEDLNAIVMENIMYN